MQRLTGIVENMGKMRSEVGNEEKGSNWTEVGTEREIPDLCGPERCAACGGNPFECGCRDVDFESKSEKRRREKERREKNEGSTP